MDHIKCVVVGDEAVGKTSLIGFITKTHMEEMLSRPIFQHYSVPVSLPNRDHQVTLSFHDTGGQDDYHAMRLETYQNVSLILICFSVISPSSFTNVQTKWYPELLRSHCANVPIILVGTKSDLRNDEELLQRLAERNLSPISQKQGKHLARDINALTFIEVSIHDEANLETFCSTILSRYCQSLKNQSERGSKKKIVLSLPCVCA